jgi:hypothetical protein
MTKGEIRKARKAARAQGQALTGELALKQSDRDNSQAVEFTESRRGYRARERWARYYDSLNGAPEGEWDR